MFGRPFGKRFPYAIGPLSVCDVGVYCATVETWIKMKLSMEVGVGHIVLDGDQAPLSKGAQPPIFGPCLFRPNAWMDQNKTWHAGLEVIVAKRLDGSRRQFV